MIGIFTMIISFFFFDCISNLISFFSLVIYFNYYFDIKVKNKALRMIYVGECIIGVILSYINIPYYSLIILIIPLILYVMVVYSGTYIKKTLYLVKYAILFYIPYAFIYIFITFSLERFKLINNPVYQNFKGLMAYTATFVIFTITFNNKKLAKDKLSNPYKKVLYGSFSLILLSLLLLTCSYVAKDLKISMELAIYFSYFINILLIFLLLNIFNNLILHLKESEQNNLKLQEYELKLTYYNDISKSIEDLRSLRHDFKNHMNIIGGYITEYETEKALDYISSITEVSYDSLHMVTSPNTILSAILNSKKIECSNQNIAIDYTLNLKNIYHISDIDIVIIIGNILDNAIYAASTLDNTKPAITLSIIQADSYLVITCQNPYTNEILMKNGDLISTKTDSGNHGIGLRNVRNSVENYNGEFHYTYDNNIFTVRILLPNYI